MLIVAAYSLQGGAMDAMADQATQLLTGHLQIQNPAYADDPSLRNLVPDATAVARALQSVPGVTAVAQRAVGFALVSVGERSYGAQVMGVDPQAEPAVSSLANAGGKGALHRGSERRAARVGDRAQPRHRRGRRIRPARQQARRQRRRAVAARHAASSNPVRPNSIARWCRFSWPRSRTSSGSAIRCTWWSRG